MNLVWFRNDLRIYDNPALMAATKQQSDPLAAVYILCDQQNEQYGIGANQQAYLYQSLKQLHQDLTKKQIPLFIIEGSTFSEAVNQLESLCSALAVKNLYFNIEYPIDERTRDKQVVDRLQDRVQCHRLVGDSLVAPWLVVNGSNEGYKVFTAFSKSHANIISDMPVEPSASCKKQSEENYQAVIKLTKDNAEKRIANTSSLSIGSLLSNTESWLKNCQPDSMTSATIPHSSHSKIKTQMENFCVEYIDDYQKQRDFPYQNATSQISPALALGCISAAECYAIAQQSESDNASAWTRQLVWRDFYRSVMWHYPHVCKGKAFLEVDNAIRWSRDLVAIDKVRSARTGIPIIDAAIQQLKQTGWMHNRLRMIVASYFCKNLWLDWRIGESFFAEHLFDYDFANNNGGWQWSASVGTDAAPYFRVFNPQSQQTKFDKDGLFIKRWLKPFKSIESNKIHRFENQRFEDYPPIQVDLKSSRKQAIESFKNAKQSLQHG